jgi:hypothetical protein
MDILYNNSGSRHTPARAATAPVILLIHAWCAAMFSGGALARPLRGQLGPLRGQEGPLRPHERARAGPGNFPVDGLLIEPDVTAAVVGFGPPTYGGSS